MPRRASGNRDEGREGRRKERRATPAPERPTPGPQPIVRGPVVQGQAPQEMHSSEDAGRKSARTVQGPGVGGPKAVEYRPAPPPGEERRHPGRGRGRGTSEGGR